MGKLIFKKIQGEIQQNNKTEKLKSFNWNKSEAVMI